MGTAGLGSNRVSVHAPSAAPGSHVKSLSSTWLVVLLHWLVAKINTGSVGQRQRTWLVDKSDQKCLTLIISF